MDNLVLQTIRERRSIRKYKPGQITDEELRVILEAGRLAPSGGNNRSSHFLVIQNKTILQELSALAAAELAGMEIREDTYKSLQSAICRSKAGGYDFTFGAPTCIAAANCRGYPNAMADCSAALENMMLAAYSAGVGSCWVNQLRWLSENPAICSYTQKLGLGGDEVICGGLVLGYPDQQPPAPERKGNRVTIIK